MVWRKGFFAFLQPLCLFTLRQNPRTRLVRILCNYPVHVNFQKIYFLIFRHVQSFCIYFILFGLRHFNYVLNIYFTDSNSCFKFMIVKSCIAMQCSEIRVNIKVLRLSVHVLFTNRRTCWPRDDFDFFLLIILWPLSASICK